MDKYLATGTCICGRKVSREYTSNVLRGLESLSDDYKLKMKCVCNESGMSGNVPKSTVHIRQLLREDKLNKILN